MDLIPSPSPEGEGDCVELVDLIPSPSPRRRRGQCGALGLEFFVGEKGIVCFCCMKSLLV